jgi:3'-phosphoadenosine 5'-phosphosulfate sulfotransferase (PAPS reductase)/FAD synthetase
MTQTSLVFSSDAPARSVVIQQPTSRLAEQAVRHIEHALESIEVALIGCSFGKDSTVILGLTLQAARNLKSRGIQKRIVVVTSDTGVENPAVARHASRASESMLAWSEGLGLSVEQRWVRPEASAHYLVQMIGGRAIASTQGNNSGCAVDLKIRPMEKLLKELAMECGAEHILTLIGTRYDESVTRGSRMRDRGESATKPQTKADGSLLISPIANWSEGDVWGFLNATPARRGFDSLDYSGVIALYEAIGESTCSIGAIDPNFTKKSTSCGSSRTGCWACQKVSRDHSLEGMLLQYPAYEPLNRLSRTIRAGHYVPGNRSLLSRTISPEGTITVSANGYGAQWTRSLLKWTLTIDANEDDRAFTTGKPRRFNRLLEPEHIILIGFYWARYGLHEAGDFIRIYDAVATGTRYPLPTDDELTQIEQLSDKKQIKTAIGKLHLPKTDTKANSGLSQTSYQDGWRSVLGDLANFDGAHNNCAVPAMDEDRYTSGAGHHHDSMVSADTLSADVTHLLNADQAPTIAYHDFMWWWAMEFSAGQKSHMDEMNWLVREDVIRARKGYQSQLVRYQNYARHVDELGLSGSRSTLTNITAHPQFEPAHKYAQGLFA